MTTRLQFLLWMLWIAAGGVLLSGCRQAGMEIRRPADAAVGRIGVMTGTTGEAIVRERFPRASVKSFDDVMDAVAALHSGQLDALVTAFPAALQVTKKNPGLVLLEEVLSHEDTAIALRKGDTEMRGRLNALIAELGREGTLDDMRRRWFKRDLEPYEEPAIPLPTEGEPLRIGVSATREPFSFVDKDGRVTGHDGELARIIGRRLNRPIEFLNMRFMALIPALQSGKVDLIVSGMTATDERRKSVDFTEPYYANAQVMLVRGGDTSASQDRPLSSLADVQGRRVGALLGSAHDTYASRNFTQSTVLQYKTAADVVLAVKSNKASLTGDPGSAEGPRPGFLGRISGSFQNNILREKRYLLLWDGLKTTIIISVCATLVGTLLGAGVCWMRMSSHALANRAARLYIAVLRGTPVLLLLMLIFYVVFASVNVSPVLVAIIAFALNFAAYSAEVFRTGIEGIDRGQMEAGIAMGFTRFSTFRFIILPQTVQRILPVYKGEFISLVKMTSIVGYIAVQDLTKASDIIRSRTFDAFFPLVMVAVLYFGISWTLIQALEFLERATDPRRRRRRRRGLQSPTPPSP